jgi:hypothetical protein
MVQLTLSNAVDQTQKIVVEVPAGTSVAQAARDAGIAPQGSFDVFTPGGEAVTQASVDQHRDAVLYVGPQKVAGGAEEFVLEPEPGVEVADGPPAGPKTVVFVSTYDSTVRHEVVPQEGQNARDAATMAGLAPRDGSGWEVFDALGVVVGDRVATELTGEVLYVGPRAIEAGGVNLEDISKVRTDFPSIRVVRGHTRGNEVDLIHMAIQDERNRTTGSQFECVIDLRSEGGWGTHVLNLREGVRCPHVYTRSRVPGTAKDSFVVCEGNSREAIGKSGKSASAKLSGYLNHIASLLNS